MTAMEIWGAIDRRYEVMCDADGRCWCGADVSSAHAVILREKNGVLELVRYEAKCSTVGTVVGEMTATKQHTAPWEKSTIYKSEKKSPW
jgi:hypothetical protein